MPSGLTSSRSASLQPSSANFEAQYGTEPADRHATADASELQDVPAFLRPHGRQDDAGHLGGGEEVDLHLLAQLLGREFLDRAKRPPPGDVGEHINAAEAAKRGVDGS